MTSEAMQRLLLDASVVSRLACPVCLGDLRVEETRLVCVDCGRGYPVVDGIPVLIGDRAPASELR